MRGVPGELPDFALEVYLGEWEFAARHHLTASDAQTLTIAEVLALADPEQRERFEQLAESMTVDNKPTSPSLLEKMKDLFS